MKFVTLTTCTKYKFLLDIKQIIDQDFKEFGQKMHASEK